MKLLLIGWDTADWSLVRQLLDRGMMPRLQLLLSKAISGELQVVRPFDTAALWTSMVTGKRAMSHGVLNSIESTPCRTCISPTSRWTCTARPIWSMLSAAGYRTHTFGWPATHPVEPINGVAVSDLFAEYGDVDSVYPPRLSEAFRDLRLSPTDIDVASLVTLLPRATELNPAGDQRLHVVAQFLASTASLHAAATWALEHERWDFAAVRYSGLARLVRIFGGAYAVAGAGERSEEADLFGELIPNAYRFFDMLLRRLLELAGPEASVMLVSQQGWAPPSNSAAPRRSRPEPGLLIAAGAAFKPGGQLADANVCDVAPTILRLFGLPADPESHGRAWDDVLSRAAPAGDAERSCHEFGERADDSSQAGSSQPSPALDDESVAHLLALGYLDRPDDFLRLAIEQLNEERQWRLAEAWIDGGQFERAARVLEELVQLAPTSTAYRSVLAEAYFRAGEYDACRRTIQSLVAEGVDTPLARAGLAALDTLEGCADVAVENLRQAEAMGGASASILEMIGRLYLGLRRRGDAARALDAAIVADPARASAHEGRAITCLYAGDASSAERHAREALKLSPQSFEARCHLGLALARQDRSDEAIATLREAVVLDQRGGAMAHRHLADLLERRGDHAFALHHRALSYRRDRPSRQPQFDFGWITDAWME